LLTLADPGGGAPGARARPPPPPLTAKDPFLPQTIYIVAFFRSLRTRFVLKEIGPTHTQK